MDIYKARIDAPFRVISREAVEADTMKKEPWYQENSTNEGSQFAICPACDNPIQLIGLYHLPANVSAPYGRHIGHSIAGLAIADAETREGCPLFKPRRYAKSSRKVRQEGLPQKILDTLIAQFDRVIYLLQKQTGIRFSRNLVRHMLLKYQGERGHLYMGASLINIPWIFAYMADSQSLFGQDVSANPTLASAIEKAIPAAQILDGRVTAREIAGKRSFFELNLCFIHHRSSTGGAGEPWTEQMTMVVSTPPPSARQPLAIYQQQIVFDHIHFQNLLQFNDAHRQLHWVELAREVLGG